MWKHDQVEIQVIVFTYSLLAVARSLPDKNEPHLFKRLPPVPNYLLSLPMIMKHLEVSLTLFVLLRNSAPDDGSSFMCVVYCLSTCLPLMWCPRWCLCFPYSNVIFLCTNGE